MAAQARGRPNPVFVLKLIGGFADDEGFEECTGREVIPCTMVSLTTTAGPQRLPSARPQPFSMKSESQTDRNILKLKADISQGPVAGEGLGEHPRAIFSPGNGAPILPGQPLVNQENPTAHPQP